MMVSSKSFFLAKNIHFTKIHTMKNFYSHALSVLLILLFVSCENRYRKNLESNNSNSNLSTSASESKQNVDIAKDAYQVSSDEYDEYFITRYGLLYQKFSDSPFTGRIVTNESGPDGKFVIADESWRNGKKDGTSTRWFSKLPRASRNRCHFQSERHSVSMKV